MDYEILLVWGKKDPNYAEERDLLKGQAVPEYRIYQLDESGHIGGPAEVIQAPSDNAATQVVMQMRDGRDLELWQGARLVVSLKRRIQDKSPPDRA